MRIAFAKQQYMPEYTWNTTIFKDNTPDSILDNFMLRSKNYGMIIETQADVFVLEDGKRKTGVHQMLEKIHPDGIKALYKMQRAKDQYTVHWQDYDAVICIDSFLDESLMKKYPGVLWCYYAGEHKAPEYRDSKKSPLFGYDVFMDHVLTVKHQKQISLPVSVNFPALVSRKAFENVIDTTKQDAVFLDSRVLRTYSNQAEGKLKLSQDFGVKVYAPDEWDYKNSYYEAAHRHIMPPRAYLERMAKCKYFVLMRGTREAGKPSFIGQAAIEAAALGCIVLSGHGSYPDKLCHKDGYIDPKNMTSVIRIIKKLQQDDRLCKEIIAHQYKKLKENFWDKPMMLLENLVALKQKKPH